MLEEEQNVEMLQERERAVRQLEVHNFCLLHLVVLLLFDILNSLSTFINIFVKSFLF